jgi:hypothetical protein
LSYLLDSASVFAVAGNVLEIRHSNSRVPLGGSNGGNAMKLLRGLAAAALLALATVAAGSSHAQSLAGKKIASRDLSAALSQERNAAHRRFARHFTPLLSVLQIALYIQRPTRFKLINLV